MQQAALTKAKSALLALGLLAFACRFAIPPGYMPAPLHEGGPIVFCPAGLPSGFGENAGHDHDGDHSPGSEDSAWEHCPLGALFDADSVTTEIVLALPTRQLHTRSAFAADWLVSITRAPFQARAPPVLDLIV